MADPTPQQRADYLVRKLEVFIREGRTERGMSLKTWQSLARAELTNAFADLENRLIRSRQDLTAKRLILVGASTVVTISFWAAAITIDRKFGDLAALICTGAGALLAAVLAELGLRGFAAHYRTLAREKGIERIVDFDKQLKRLEAEIWLKLKRTKERAEAESENG